MFTANEYDNVQQDFVWRTIHQRLPTLIAAIEEEIALATLSGKNPGAAGLRECIETRYYSPDLE